MDPLTLNPSAPFSPWSIEVQVEQISPAIHPSLQCVVFLLSLAIVWNSFDFCIPLEDWSDPFHHRLLLSGSLDYYALLANMLTSLNTKLSSETLFLCAISLFHTIWCVWKFMRKTETGKRDNDFLEGSEQTSNPSVKLVPQWLCHRYECYLKSPVSKPTYS